MLLELYSPLEGKIRHLTPESLHTKSQRAEQTWGAGSTDLREQI